MTKKAARGFTLIELLVVISIIGLLASVVMVSVNNARQKARVAKAQADVNAIMKGLQMYALDHGDSYASVPWQGCWTWDWAAGIGGGSVNLCSQTDWNSGWFSSYVRSVPLDPWGHSYLVDGNPDRGSGECGAGQSSICSYGADGKDNGSVNNPAMQAQGDDVCAYFEPQC